MSTRNWLTGYVLDQARRISSLSDLYCASCPSRRNSFLITYYAVWISSLGSIFDPFSLLATHRWTHSPDACRSAAGVGYHLQPAAQPRTGAKLNLANTVRWCPPRTSTAKAPQSESPENSIPQFVRASSTSLVDIFAQLCTFPPCLPFFVYTLTNTISLSASCLSGV